MVLIVLWYVAPEFFSPRNGMVLAHFNAQQGSKTKYTWWHFLNQYVFTYIKPNETTSNVDKYETTMHILDSFLSWGVVL
jgi:hypothetical protein